VVLELGVGSAVLNKGTADEITNRIKDYIQKAAPGGQLILYLTNLSTDTPPANIKVAVNAIRQYGKY